MPAGIGWRNRQTRDTGEWGEAVAADALKRSGYKIVGRRVRVGNRDEIDLVARDGEVLVFVEVKTRKSERYGRPERSVDRNKRHVMSRAAVRYLKRMKNPRVCFRFDIVEVIGAIGEDAVVRHIRNAFCLERRYSLP